MLHISLKKILSKREGLSIINDIIKIIDNPTWITDEAGNLLLGSINENLINRYPVKVVETIIGWVNGDEKAATVATLLSYLANKELEKKSIANELLDKYREMTLVYEISQKINTTLELKAVAKLIVEEGQRLIQADCGTVFLLNESTETLEEIYKSGKEILTNTNIILSQDSIIKHIVLSGTGEIINDVALDYRFTKSLEAVSSLICVPLKINDRVIGAIAIGNSLPITYVAEDLKLLITLASLAASAIENAYLHEKQLQESRREALLFRLSSQIRHSLEPNVILETTVNEIHSLLQIDRCLFSWYRPRIVCSEEVSSTTLTSWPENLADWAIVNEAKNPELDSLIGFYPVAKLDISTIKLLEKEMVWIDDVKSFIARTGQEFFLAQDSASILALPIQTRSGAIGVLSCIHCQGVRIWSDQEVELLQIVANQLAIAIAQAELYEQSRNASLIAQAQAQHLQKTLNKLQQTQAQLIQSEKMSSLGQLVAGVAHEINNPINFIFGNVTCASDYIQDLLKLLDLYTQYYPQPVPEIQAEAEAIDLKFLLNDLPKLLSSMRVGVERIRQIVLSLRNFSRLDEAEKKPVDIHEGIDNALLILAHRLKPTAGNYPIQVIKEYGELPLVECYAAQLNQVFLNIISNALDAVEDKKVLGTITIQTKLINKKDVVIRIRDNGSGIDEKFQAKIFDPFFTTKAVGKGTGLGLSISYQIVVEKHCGTLKCNSQLGEGTEFIIQIPIKPISNCISPFYQENLIHSA